MFSHFRSRPTSACDIVAIIEKVLANILEKEGYCEVTYVDVNPVVLTSMDVVALKKWLVEKEIKFEDHFESHRNEDHKWLRFPYSKDQLIDRLGVIEEEVPGDAPVRVMSQQRSSNRLI